MSNIEEKLKQPLAQLILSIADDKLMLGHRNSDWTGLAPILEEDIAFSSLAQDEIAHASVLYEFVAELTNDNPDRLAFGREANEYLCAQIVEVPDEFDWATAIARQFFCDHFDLLRLERLSKSSHKPLADLASRLHSEERMHVRHVSDWVKWLAGGTEESKTKMQKAINALTPYATMLFEQIENQSALKEANLYPGEETEMFTAWNTALSTVIKDAGLSISLAMPNPEEKGGRRGNHSKHLAPLLDEMCEVYRLEPSAKW